MRTTYRCAVCNTEWPSREQADSCARHGVEMRLLFEEWDQNRLLWHVLETRGEDKITVIIMPLALKKYNPLSWRRDNCCKTTGWMMDDLRSGNVFTSEKTRHIGAMTLGQAWRNHKIMPNFSACLNRKADFGKLRWLQLKDFWEDIVEPIIIESCGKMSLGSMYENMVMLMTEKFLAHKGGGFWPHDFLFPGMEEAKRKTFHMPDWKGEK